MSLRSSGVHVAVLLTVAAATVWAAGATPPASPSNKPKPTLGETKQEAQEAVANLVDKLFFGGKVADVTKTISDPKTYKKDAELAYSMNPIDLIYYATFDYKKELLIHVDVIRAKDSASLHNFSSSQL